jgi:hypothetical protein
MKGPGLLHTSLRDACVLLNGGLLLDQGQKGMGTGQIMIVNPQSPQTCLNWHEVGTYDNVI